MVPEIRVNRNAKFTFDVPFGLPATLQYGDGKKRALVQRENAEQASLGARLPMPSRFEPLEIER